MKDILKFLAVYIVVLTSIFSFYFTLEDKYESDALVTRNERHGVEYLRLLYQLSENIADYKSHVELEKDKGITHNVELEMISTVDRIYDFHEKYPFLKSVALREKTQSLKNLKKLQLGDAEYYDLIDFINRENYRVGDVASLLFEPDRKLYFLNTLTTHYMPEYLASLIETRKIVEEFNYKGNVDQNKQNVFIEQSKLVELSTQEIFDIISFLEAYEDAAILDRSIVSIREEIVNLPQEIETLLATRNNASDVRKYIETSHKILEYAHKLNSNIIDISELSYQEREEALNQKIFYNALLFAFIFLLISSLFVYFGIVYVTKKKQDDELKGLTSTLDKLVLFSKTDKRGIITHASEALLKLSGYSQDELLGRTHSLLRHEDMEASVYENMWKTILDKKQWEGEVKNTRKDGSIYWAQLTIQPELDDKGEIEGFTTYRVDITYQKEVELEKQKTQNALAFKSQFLSNMSHEIRTPLNGIIGLVYVALKTQLDEHQKSILHKVQSTSTILLGVINDILDISKIESGKMTIEIAPFDLKSVVGNIEDMMIDKAKDKGIFFKTQYAGLSNFHFLGDSLRISQVLTNLLSNAIKFTSEGGVIVIVEQIKPNALLFKVSDTGIGLKKESLATLFEEFTQADMSTSRKYGGTGLGLSISKNLVELMNGTITVHSEFGKGSEFSFELPLEATDLLRETAQNAIDDFNALERKVNALQGVKILVAEDNATNRMVLEMILDDTSLEIEFARDGAIALENFKQNNDYDLILMDLQMPNMNGFEATKAIREFDKEIPIIALSANVMKEDVDKALEAGVNDYLVKPIDVAKLYAALLKYIKN